MSRRDIPEINAGSMADIAFLLLIFFLVTTTMDIDAGIPRKLPPKSDPNVKPPDIKKRNVLVINVGRDGNILVNGEDYLEVNQIKNRAIEFLDNGEGKGKDGQFCNYCEGKKLVTSSIHPNRAVISLQSSRETKHGVYIQVTNELVRAYNELRNRESKKLYGEPFETILAKAKKKSKDEVLKAQITKIRDRFPMLLSEAEPIKINN